jgi:hypothetical protein
MDLVQILKAPDRSGLIGTETSGIQADAEILLLERVFCPDQDGVDLVRIRWLISISASLSRD